MIAGSFALKVDQLDALNAPRLEAEAVGTFKVITGVVVPVATVLLKSVPVVPRVKAATLVTVPVLAVAPVAIPSNFVLSAALIDPAAPVVAAEIAIVRFADKSAEVVPSIVIGAVAVIILAVDTFNANWS